MPAIAHSFSEQTTRQTVVGTAYASALSHAAGNFTAGGKYLLMVTALTDGPNATDHIKMRVVHGATAFADSEYELEPTNGTRRYNYAWFKVWTAVGAEAIDFQIACSDVAGTVGADQITIFAMRLDVDLVENTDWFYAEDGTDVALSTTPVDGATVTFTPTVSTNWLVLTTAQLQASSLVVNYATRLLPSGTYADAVPKWSREGEDVADRFVATLGRVFEDLGAVSQTFKEQSFNEVGDSGQRLHSAIFALNLNKFRTRAVVWDDTEEALGTTLWDDLLATVSLTPEVVGDVWFLATGTFDVNAAGNEVTHRLQVDGVDQPDTQTTDQYIEEEPADPIDELSVWRQTLEAAVTVAAHSATWEAEASSATGGPTIKNKLLLALTMELGGNVPAVVTIPHEALGYVEVVVQVPYEVATRVRERQLVTALRTRGQPFPGWVAGLVQETGVGTLPIGTIEDGENFVPLPAGRLETRGGSRVLLTLHDDQGSPAELSHVLGLLPKALSGAVAVGWADATDKHYAYALTSDIAFAGASEALSRTAFPSTWTRNAAARPVVARLFEKLYVCDAQPLYASRNTLVVIDAVVPPGITEPTFEFVPAGAGAAALRPYCLEEYNNVLFIAGYGDEETGTGDAPETVRHSFLGKRPDLAGGFDPNAYNIIGAEGERVTAMKKGRGLLLIAKANELYRLSGFGRAYPGWQYQVEPIFNTDGFGVANALALEHAEGWWYGIGRQGPFRTDGFDVQSLVGPRQRLWRGVSQLEFAWVRYHPDRRLVLFGVHPADAPAAKPTYPYIVWTWDLDRNVWTTDQVYLKSATAGDALDLAVVGTVPTETVKGPGAAPSAPNTTDVTLSSWRANWTNEDTSAGTEVEYWEKKTATGAWELKAVVTVNGATDFADVTGRVNHTAYYWKVRARRNGLFSDFTAEVLVRTLIQPPGLNAVCSGIGTRVTITVTQNAPGTDILVQESPQGANLWDDLRVFLDQPSGTVEFSSVQEGGGKDYRAKSSDVDWSPADSAWTAPITASC